MNEISTHKSSAEFGNKTDPLKVIMLAATLVVISLLLQCNIGFNLADEGFLWYGAEQTLLGQIPLRDFQSYDPGRYYWCAFWMKLFGNGIISLRLSLAIFQVLGLSLGLLALKRCICSWKVMVIAGSILLLWMIPRHKLFDCSLSMAAVFFALKLIENPSFRQCFISGLFIGLAAFFGRNHGLYNLLAFGMLVVFIRFKLEKIDLLRSGVSMGCGILLGYSPMLIMMLSAPDFFDAFLTPFKRILFRGSTNLPLPIPFPWRYDYSKMNFAQGVCAFSIGTFFIMLPWVYVSNIASLLICKKNLIKNKSLLTASSFVGVVYMHHVFSRADISHLGQGIAPLLIALLALPFAFGFVRKKRFCVFGLVILLLMTLFSVGKLSKFYAKTNAEPGIYVKSDIVEDTLWLPHGQANHIQTISRINSQMISPEEGFLIAPWQPGMYPVLQRESPLWDIYLLFPETETRQNEMIEELKQKKVNWALLSNMPLDGREELRLSNTHKLLWNYLMENYQVVEVDGLNPNYMLLRREPGK